LIFYTRAAIPWALECDQKKETSRDTLFRDLAPVLKKDDPEALTYPRTATMIIVGALFFGGFGYTLINTRIELCGMFHFFLTALVITTQIAFGIGFAVHLYFIHFNNVSHSGVYAGYELLEGTCNPSKFMKIPAEIENRVAMATLLLNITFFVAAASILFAIGASVVLCKVYS